MGDHRPPDRPADGAPQLSAEIGPGVGPSLPTTIGPGPGEAPGIEIDWNANGKADAPERVPKRTGPRKPRPVGRPVECTPALTVVVERELARGRTVRTACAIAGITDETHYRWISRADEGEPFCGYTERVKIAREMGRAKLEGVILQAAEDGDWRAAKTYLQHQYPADWTPRTELTGKDGGAIQVAIDITAQIDAALASRSDAEIGLPDFLDSPQITER